MNNKVLFNTGSCVITVGANEFFQNRNDLFKLLERHVVGDWGDLSEEDKIANNDAIADGERIVSRYNVNVDIDEYDEPTFISIYIITESDRSYTTVMLCSEY